MFDFKNCQKRKPIIFIGCSTERIDIAYAIQNSLSEFAETSIWKQNTFYPSGNTLFSLLEKMGKIDYAIFLLTPDDTVTSREKTYQGIRDNILFEAGIAFGCLGTDRVFLLMPRNNPPIIPTDLAGITLIPYDEPGRESWSSAIGSACTEIRESIKKDWAPICELEFPISGKWSCRFPGGIPLEKMYLNACSESQRDFFDRLSNAQNQITIFGFTRHSLAESDLLMDLLKKKAETIPVTIYLMDPNCVSRKERYRIETAMYEGERIYTIIEKFKKLAEGNPEKLKMYYYNFPCSFGIEEIDDACRVILYGHGIRGKEGPIFIFRAGNPYYQYFKNQLIWMNDLANGDKSFNWYRETKNIIIRPLS